MGVVAEGVGVLGAEVGLDTAQGEVHDGEAAGGGVAFIFDAELELEAEVGRGVFGCAFGGHGGVRKIPRPSVGLNEVESIGNQSRLMAKPGEVRM